MALNLLVCFIVQNNKKDLEFIELKLNYKAQLQDTIQVFWGETEEFIEENSQTIFSCSGILRFQIPTYISYLRIDLGTQPDKKEVTDIIISYKEWNEEFNLFQKQNFLYSNDIVHLEEIENGARLETIGQDPYCVFYLGDMIGLKKIQEKKVNEKALFICSCLDLIAICLFKCLKKMKEMMDSGTTVLFVSHDISAIRRFCTRGIWIHNGEIQKDGEVNEVADEYLGFLRYKEEKEQTIISSLNEFQDKKAIVAEVVYFAMLDRIGNERYEYELEEYVKLQIVYDVYDDKIKDPVLGAAIMREDHTYICGVNTLLDRVKIPWKYGRNIFYLEYPLGIRAVGGKYYFDIAIFDETATVQIQYIKNIKQFKIISEYRGEGCCIIPHEWK